MSFSLKHFLVSVAISTQVASVPLNWIKNKITKIQENFNEIVKNCLKLNVYKFLTRTNLSSLLLGVSAIERWELDGNVNWDLKLCPL